MYPTLLSPLDSHYTFVCQLFGRKLSNHSLLLTVCASTIVLHDIVDDRNRSSKVVKKIVTSRKFVRYLCLPLLHFAYTGHALTSFLKTCSCRRIQTFHSTITNLSNKLFVIVIFFRLTAVIHGNKVVIV